MIRKIGLTLAGLILFLGLAAAVTYLSTMPEPVADGAESENWLQPGPYNVASAELVFIDESRATAENNGYPATASRVFPTTIWYPNLYPKDSRVKHPLIIHSHGFVSSRNDLGYAAEHLASYGYVVVAADFPLTSGSTPGGPNANDLINQPTDISFLIDSILNLSAEEKPFDGEIDNSRIGLMGYSLGGITTTLATYHPRLRDQRIAAAISIAGPSVGLSSKFYQTTDIPFLMIAGTLDALIDFQTNAAIIPRRVGNSALLGITGGSHLGFAGISEPLLRFMQHPDGIGCDAVLSNLNEAPNTTLLALGTEADGIYLEPDAPGVCETMPTQQALHPGRQQMITQIAVLAFFESVFADETARREAAMLELSESLAADLQEASYTASY